MSALADRLREAASNPFALDANDLRSAASALDADASSKAVTQALVEVHDRIKDKAAFLKRHGFDEFERGMQEAAETVRLMMEGK